MLVSLSTLLQALLLFVYRGTADCTAVPVGAQLDPNPAVVGDMYINTGTGTSATDSVTGY